MNYRKDKYGNDISILGYGCMRFTRKGAGIDFDKAEAQVMHAIELGVNYYDTAYLYPGSEECLGKILSKNNCRDKVKIATKLPQYMVKKKEQIDNFFNEELKRLQTDYIDYYLMHMLTDIKNWDNLVNFGIIDWIKVKKESGAIKNIGFSFHGNSDMFIQILNAYDWDFCQIQYNYLDENTQAGRKGLDAAYAKGIPVIIMEPLRGGKLVNMLPDKAVKLIKGNEHGWSNAEWGLRWLWNQKAVTCVLSGMNSMEMVDENIRIASSTEADSLTSDDMKVYEDIVRYIKEKEMVGCTGCGYCMPCPMGVDIPGNFRCYNKMYSENKKSGRFEFVQTVGLREKPALASQCVQCGKCEQHCPQSIPIREKLKEADKQLRPWTYKIAIKVANRYVLKRKKKK